MPLPDPVFAVSHGVFQLATPQGIDPGRDERFIAAVRSEFPNLINRQFLPPETPALVPHLVLASTSSQLALSAVQADFEVRFYGEFPSDIERCVAYVERKMRSVLTGFSEAGMVPSTVGLVSTLRFSLRDRPDETATSHILTTHLRSDVPLDDVQDATARIAVRLRDTYFITLTVGNYESRVLERPFIPGVTRLHAWPWEGRVEDVGLELAIDINNVLEAREHDDPPVVTDQGLTAITRLLHEIATNAGPRFADTGDLSVEEMTATSLS
jgi:hypothetical protein